MTHLEKVKARLLPKSVATSLNTAIREWAHRGIMIEHPGATGICGLCGHEGLRYHFHILNSLTGCTRGLWTGSKCIETWAVPVFDEQGNVLAESDVPTALETTKRNARLARVLATLESLSEHEQELESICHYYRENGYLTPNQVVLVQWRLDKNEIFFKLSDFKVSLRRHAHQAQVKKMDAWKLDKILDAFTGSQRAIVQRIRGEASSS